MAGLYSSSGIGGGSEILQYMAGLRIQRVLNVDPELGYDSIKCFESLQGLERIVRINVKRNVFQKGFSGRKCIESKEAMDSRDVR